MHYRVPVFIFKPPENEALVFEPWIIFPGDVFISLWFYSPPNSSEPFHKKGDKKRERKLSSGEISCLFCLHAPQPAQIKPCASLISQRTINNIRTKINEKTSRNQHGRNNMELNWSSSKLISNIPVSYIRKSKDKAPQFDLSENYVDDKYKLEY